MVACVVGGLGVGLVIVLLGGLVVVVMIVFYVVILDLVSDHYWLAEWLLM